MIRMMMPRSRCTMEKIYMMSRNIQRPIQKLMSISCRLISLNLIRCLEIHVPKAVNPTIAYMPRK